MSSNEKRVYLVPSTNEDNNAFVGVRINNDSTTDTSKSTQLFGAGANATKNRNVMVVLLTPEVLVSPLSPETRMRDF